MGTLVKYSTSADVERALDNGQTAFEKISNMYNKEDIENLVTQKVADIIANAPEDFDTLKELYDWLVSHEDSAAAMNSAIQKNTDDVLKLKNDVSINSQSLGLERKNIFNKDGEINSMYNGTTIATGTTKNTVDGNVITFNRRSGNEYLTGQFISGLAGKTVKITFNCLSTGSATQGTFRIMKRDNSSALKVEVFGTGEKTYTYACGANDELLFCFGGNGSAAGVQIENLMIRDANISDDAYENYVPSVKEQLDELFSRIIALES